MRVHLLIFYYLDSRSRARVKTSKRQLRWGIFEGPPDLGPHAVNHRRVERRDWVEKLMTFLQLFGLVGPGAAPKQACHPHRHDAELQTSRKRHSAPPAQHRRADHHDPPLARERSHTQSHASRARVHSG